MEQIKKQIEEQLKNTKVFLATPCYGGQCTTGYLSSMFYLSKAMHEINLQNTLATCINESLITRARNRLVKLFLDTDCTHLMFIDADISFNPLDVIRLLMHNKELVCASYPMKGLMLQNLIGKIFDNAEDIEKALHNYVINLAKEDQAKFKDNQGPVRINTENGLVEIMDAGTGFMCIKREVIEKMIKAYPETAYISEEDNREWHALFDCIIDNGRYLSEDYTFCRRWQKIGGKVWLDPDVTLDHIGTYTYKGSPQFFWGENLDIKNSLK
jgi:hypothetical protein